MKCVNVVDIASSSSLKINLQNQNSPVADLTLRSIVIHETSFLHVVTTFLT